MKIPPAKLFSTKGSLIYSSTKRLAQDPISSLWNRCDQSFQVGTSPFDNAGGRHQDFPFRAPICPSHIAGPGPQEQEHSSNESMHMWTLRRVLRLASESSPSSGKGFKTHSRGGSHLLSRHSGDCLCLQNYCTSHPQGDSHMTPFSCLFLNHCLICLPLSSPLK